MTTPPRPIGYLLKRAQHLLRLKMDDVLSALSLTAPQYAVMEAVDGNPGATNAELAREALVTAQTMGGLIQTLERTGYVERAAVEGNARRIANRLTPAGIKALRDARRETRRLEQQLVARLDRASLEIFNAALVAIADELSSERYSSN